MGCRLSFLQVPPCWLVSSPHPTEPSACIRGRCTPPAQPLARAAAIPAPSPPIHVCMSMSALVAVPVVAMPFHGADLARSAGPGTHAGELHDVYRATGAAEPGQVVRGDGSVRPDVRRLERRGYALLPHLRQVAVLQEPDPLLGLAKVYRGLGEGQVPQECVRAPPPCMRPLLCLHAGPTFPCPWPGAAVSTWPWAFKSQRSCASRCLHALLHAASTLHVRCGAAVHLLSRTHPQLAQGRPRCSTASGCSHVSVCKTGTEPRQNSWSYMHADSLCG